MDVKEIFGQWGEITSICIKASTSKVNFTEEPLKFAFINFKNEDDAASAYKEAKMSAFVKALIHDGHDQKIDYIFYAQNKSVRQAYLRMKKNMVSQIPN